MRALIASTTHHLLEIGGAAFLISLALPTGWWAILLSLAGGWLIGSFAEYALHRYALHGPRILSSPHGRHHIDPEEAQLDAVSYLAPFLLQACAGFLAFALTGAAGVAQAFVAGAMLQYSYFRIIHRLLHRSPPVAILSGLQKFHDDHHRHNVINFGVTSQFWDRWLGTALTEDEASCPSPTLDTQLPVAIHDPRPISDAPRNFLERLAVQWLRDIRDLAFIRLGAQASLVLLPGALLIYLLPPWLAALLAPPYWWLLYARFGGPVMLMVHALFHRKAFTGPGRWIDRYLRHLLPMLYGLQPFAYHPQHMIMHHVENNRWADLSTTFGYRRDHWPDFLRYWLRFMGRDNLLLARYLKQRGHHRVLKRFLLGSIAWLLAVGGLTVIAPMATLIVFVIPYVLTRFFLMAGNWAQHAFVNPDESDPRLGHSTILVNASQNQRCFNDGYHAVHHRHPGMHWTEMSASFQREWQHYAGQRVLVFDGIPNNQVIWWCLMRGDFAFLASHLADFGWLPKSQQERILLLKHRVAATPAR